MRATSELFLNPVKITFKDAKFCVAAFLPFIWVFIITDDEYSHS